MLPMLLAVEVSDWDKADVLIGGIAAGLLIIVIGIQIWTTWQAKAAAEAAKISADSAVEANRRAKEEMDIRLTPFVSITSVDPYAVKDATGLIVLRKDPGTGLLDVGNLGVADGPKFVLYRITIVNSGPVAALQAGFGHGKGFDRNLAYKDMRDDTGHVDSLIPPETTTTSDVDIPLQDVRRFRAEDGDPYYLAFSVAYQDRNREGKLVEIEWRFRSAAAEILRHSAPEPFTDSSSATQQPPAPAPNRDAH